MPTTPGRACIVRLSPVRRYKLTIKSTSESSFFVEIPNYVSLRCFSTHRSWKRPRALSPLPPSSSAYGPSDSAFPSPSQYGWGKRMCILGVHQDWLDGSIKRVLRFGLLRCSRFDQMCVACAKCWWGDAKCPVGLEPYDDVDADSWKFSSSTIAY
jgi:hypothetical protein